jgi:hypothetical protein
MYLQLQAFHYSLNCIMECAFSCDLVDAYFGEGGYTIGHYILSYLLISDNRQRLINVDGSIIILSLVFHPGQTTKQNKQPNICFFIIPHRFITYLGRKVCMVTCSHFISFAITIS